MKKPPPDSIFLQESLEHRILHGLACEWDNACWMIPSQERKYMKPPLFSLRDMGRRLGYWSYEKNELVLSRSLVMNSPWDDVREVLFHEMAHQYASQVLGAVDEAPHGAAFRRACRLLRANPKASGRYRPLHDLLQNRDPGANDRILLRVKKLMSLAESDNRHEAEAAMSKAHQLIKKYNIDLLQESRRREFVSIFAGAPALRHPRETYHLANLLQTFYFIQGIWVSAYVLEKGKMGRVFEISGTAPNVRIASYVHDCVMHFIDMQWNRYNRGKGLNRHRKTDFAVGIIEGFHHKLKHDRPGKSAAPAADALIAVEDPSLTRYMAVKYPHTRSFRRAVSSQDEGVLQDGYHIGEKLVISKGVAQHGKSDRQLPYLHE